MRQVFSAEAKQVIIKKVLSDNGQTMTEIALAHNIGCSTLSEWVKRFKSENRYETKPTSAAHASLTLAERFKHLQATYGQDDVMIGAYCRTHGLYPHQLTQWEADFMTSPILEKQSPYRAEVKALHAEIKSLKHLLLRKDKVLAETVALLVLKKKAAHIWGDSEDD